MNRRNRTEFLLIFAITLFAFGLRLWQLDRTPPGWRDDEIINSLVISQHVLDGDFAVYYPDASGHEALYHSLNAIFLSLFGPTIWGIRYLSVILGTLAVPLTYLLGRKLFGATVGLVAAASLAVSFWALMYSRIGLRHVLMPPLTLAAFYFFWCGFEAKNQRLKIREWRSILNLHSPLFNFSISAIFMSLGFYTYFASRGLPLILAAFLIYAALVAWPMVKSKWRGLLWLFVLAVILAVPLVLTLQQQPESEARVAELAVPLVALGEGDVTPLMEHVLLTLGMFVNQGDGEWLYNIPDRPVLTSIGAVFFWLGVAITAVLTLIPLWHKLRQSLQKQPARPAKHVELASAFLLLWWLAGISPAFISVPPASLGHTILAQPAVFMLAAVPVGWLARKWPALNLPKRWKTAVVALLGLVLIVNIAARDWPDYFQNWPERGMVRFLYRANFNELADYVNENAALTDFGVNSFLAGPWDQLAFAADLRNDDARPRWFNQERAVLLQPDLSFTGYPETAVAFPDAYQTTDTAVAGYTLAQVDYAQSADEPVCFENGLCLETAVYNPASHTLDLTWQVSRVLDLPEREIISNPPPPGVYAGPRLLVFAQLLDANGEFLVGDDGLWVDIYSLQAGDVFKQQHQFA
ncbi:MAG: glycosyltransferase family 39 protein, partial [Anaerolineae bacterium]|nr:glycosyltransferase family 39 protein [Anaerolineae bacterium]